MQNRPTKTSAVPSTANATAAASHPIDLQHKNRGLFETNTGCIMILTTPTAIFKRKEQLDITKWEIDNAHTSLSCTPAWQLALIVQ